MSEAPVVWQGWPHAPAPLAALPLFCRPGCVRAAGATGGSGVRVVDETGTPRVLGMPAQVREIVRILWLRLVDAVLAALAFVMVPRGKPAAAVAPHAGGGPVVLVLPVLPDLSHTFVYREVLAILRQRPDWRVLALARNALAPVHAEARDLLAAAVFLPREGVTRRALRVFGWLLQRQGRSLFALYRAQPGGSVRDLLGKQPLRDPRHPGNAFVLADHLRALRPRHIHVYGSTWPANVALGAAHLLDVPFSISSYVDFEFPYSHKLLAEKVARARFFRVVTAFCAARLRELPELPSLPAERVPVVLLGLDLEDWAERAAPTGRGVVVSAARLVPKKGLHLVPAALAALRARGVSCRWRLIGDGPERAAIEQACLTHGVADLVDWLGAQDNAAVRRELRAADAALLPCVIAADGERDGIPIFLCEAMALGVPVVTTPVSGIPELVRDGDTGFLAAPGDGAALAAVLARVLGDPQGARRIGERGRDAVRSTLDVHAKAGQLIGLIER